MTEEMRGLLWLRQRRLSLEADADKILDFCRDNRIEIDRATVRAWAAAHQKQETQEGRTE